MFYANGQFDRADHLRKDDAALSELFRTDTAQLLPVWRGKLLVGDGPTALTIPVKSCPPDNETKIFLGMLNKVAVFAQSLSTLEESELTSWVDLAAQTNTTTQTASFEDLRIVGPSMSADDGAMMAYARGLTYWHDTCQHCSRCGHSLHSANGGHIKTCDNAECHYQSFPRTDPAVIMLVTREASDNAAALCLLGRNAAWPPGAYSTLAGFVETGESLEEAVQREVFEEANITTENVRYIASQPWPFPRSIMLGFEASATSTDITVDPTELDDARWFSVEEIKTFGTWGDEQSEFALPRTDSIARFLIDRWVSAHE